MIVPTAGMGDREVVLFWPWASEAGLKTQPGEDRKTQEMESQRKKDRGTAREWSREGQQGSELENMP